MLWTGAGGEGGGRRRGRGPGLLPPRTRRLRSVRVRCCLVRSGRDVGPPGPACACGRARRSGDRARAGCWTGSGWRAPGSGPAGRSGRARSADVGPRERPLGGSTGRPPLLHGVQLWIAPPQQRRFGEPEFAHHADLPVITTAEGVRITVVAGEFAGERSPARVYTPLVGMEVALPRPGRFTLLPTTGMLATAPRPWAAPPPAAARPESRSGCSPTYPSAPGRSRCRRPARAGSSSSAGCRWVRLWSCGGTSSPEPERRLLRRVTRGSPVNSAR